jgi:beta-glucanase (GH16 family)
MPFIIGMWPYSYDSCDVGTFPNQTAKDGTPAAAATGSPKGTEISFLPGQKLSACTCPGSDHPGPSTNKGRGVPEIDVLETQIDTSLMRAQVSQSFQTAPYNYQYQFVNTSPSATIYDTTISQPNTYLGGIYQQAVSTLTYIDSANFNDKGYAKYGYEWWSDPNHRDQGYVTWFSEGKEVVTIEASAVGPDSITQVSQRLISEEPMVGARTKVTSATATDRGLCSTLFSIWVYHPGSKNRIGSICSSQVRCISTIFGCTNGKT